MNQGILAIMAIQKYGIKNLRNNLSQNPTQFFLNYTTIPLVMIFTLFTTT